MKPFKEAKKATGKKDDGKKDFSKRDFSMTADKKIERINLTMEKRIDVEKPDRTREIIDRYYFL
jgi:hypothetical protein